MLTPRLALPPAPKAERDMSGILCGTGLFVLLIIVIIGLAPLSAHKAIGSTGDGSTARQLAYVGLFAFVLAAAQTVKDLRILLKVPFSMVLLLAWCWLSMTWAIEPSVTMRRLLLTCIIVWTVFVAIERAGYERTITTLHAVLLVTLIVNYIAIAVSPSAIHQVADVVDLNLIGNWRGVLPQKNFAGAVCAFSVILLTFSGQRFQPLIRIGLIAAAAYFLYRTHSKTSISLLFVSIAVGGLYYIYNIKYRHLIVPFFVILISFTALFSQNYWPDIASGFNQDTFTGRGLIWTVLLAYAQDHWALGAGYGSFWNIGPSSPVYFYTHSWVRLLGNGHNGYLDLLVQIGLPGLILAIFAMIIAPLAKLLTSKTISKPHGALLSAMLVFCASHNLTESSILDRDMVVQVFMLVTLALISLAIRAPKIDLSTQNRYWLWVPPRQRNAGAVDSAQEKGVEA